MQGIAVSLIILSLLSLLFVGPLYFSNLTRFLNRLRDAHLQEWERLDGPLLAPLDRSANSSKFMGYLMNRRYLAIDDAELGEIGNKARSFLIACVTLFGIMFLSFLLIAIAR